MPRLPTADALGRRLTPQARIDIAQARTGAVGDALRVAGRALGEYADERARNEETEARNADADALFKARRELDDWERDAIFGEQGAVNRLGVHAAAVPDELQKGFDERAEAVFATLGSERQRRAFNEMATARRAQVLDWGAKHAHRERELVDAKEFDDELSAMVNRASLMPDRAKGEQDIGEARIIGRYRERGMDPERALRDFRDKLHTGVVNAMLAVDNWQGALKHLDANFKHLDPATGLRLRSTLKKHADALEGAQDAREVVSAVLPKMAPDEFSRIVNITMQTESGGRRYGEDGKLLQGPLTRTGERAQGEMQVMPGTSRAPGFGVKPAKDDSPEELARVGRDYLAAMVKEFDGDLAAAWAAYNAGPARVRQEMKDAAKRGNPGAWLTNMPAETQAYVVKNVKAYETGGGVPSRPTLQEVHNALRERLPSNPERLRVALDESSRLYKEQTDALKQRDDEAEAEAMRVLMGNGGSWAQVPASVKGAVPPSKVGGLMEFANKIAKGDDRTSLWLYNKLESDPAFLRGLSDPEFFKLRKDLSDADFKHFSNKRAKLLSPTEKDSNGPGELNTQAIKSALDDRLRSLKLDPSPKDKGSEAELIGSMRKFINDSILDAQRGLGRRMDDGETIKFIDALFARQAKSSGFFGAGVAKPVVTMAYGDIPREDRNAVRAALQKSGVADPTHDQIRETYWRWKTQ